MKCNYSPTHTKIYKYMHIFTIYVICVYLMWFLYICVYKYHVVIFNIYSMYIFSFIIFIQISVKIFVN